MKSRPIASNLRHSSTRSGMHFLVTLAVAATFLTTQTLAQAPQVQTPQATAEVANPAPTATAPLPDAPTTSSSSEEAQLRMPEMSARLNIMPALDAAQGSNVVSTPVKTHKGLAKTSAILGTVVLGLGIGTFWLQSHCKTDNGPCGTLHAASIGMMAGGGAAAGVGYYFWFHKP